METLRLSADKVRDYFVDNCADDYLVEYASPVAKILKSGLKWHHASFNDCPVAKIYGTTTCHDNYNLPTSELASNVDRAVRALSEHHAISGVEIELI